MKLCKCGCGQEIIIKPHHKYYGVPDYINGHHSRGKRRPSSRKGKTWEEIFGPKKATKMKKELSESCKGRKQTEQHRKNNSESHKGQKAWNKGHTKETDPRVAKISEKLIGKEPWSKGKTKETDERVRRGAEKRKGKPWPEEFKGRPSFRKGKTFEELYGEERALEMKKAQSESHKGQPNHNPHGIGNGGYREDLGHYVRSSWEANFARFLKWFGVKYEYEKHRFDLGDCTYCPDFYLPEVNLFIEIKGWIRPRCRKKIKLFKKQYSKERLVIYGELERDKWNIISNDYHQFEKQYKDVVPNWE